MQDGNSRTYEIEGKTLGFPSLYPDGSSAIGLFLVKSSVASELIAESGFEIASFAPGKAVMSLSCVHYRASDCGPYNEIAIAFFVKKKGAKRGFPYLGNWIALARDNSATYIWKLPVTTKLANDAGILMWGLPKTIEKIEFDVLAGRGHFHLTMDEQEVLHYSVKADGTRHEAPQSSTVYSNFEGGPCETSLTHEYWDMGLRVGDGLLALGDHPISDKLRRLGLPKRPLLSAWIGRLSLSVTAPSKL